MKIERILGAKTKTWKSIKFHLITFDYAASFR